MIIVLEMYKQEDFIGLKNALKNREIDNEARASEEAEMKQKIH